MVMMLFIDMFSEPQTWIKFRSTMFQKCEQNAYWVDFGGLQSSFKIA